VVAEQALTAHFVEAFGNKQVLPWPQKQSQHMIRNFWNVDLRCREVINTLSSHSLKV
jgi:hypothetical protein